MATSITVPFVPPISTSIYKIEPQYLVQVWPSTAIPRADVDTFCINDIIGNLMKPYSSGGGTTVKEIPLTNAQQARLTAAGTQFPAGGIQNMLAVAPPTMQAHLINMAADGQFPVGEIPTTSGNVPTAVPVSHWSQEWNAPNQGFDMIAYLEYVEITTTIRDGASAAVGSSTLKESSLNGFILRPMVEPLNLVLAGDVDANGKLRDPSRPPPVGDPGYATVTMKVNAGVNTGMPAQTAIAQNQGFDRVMPFAPGRPQATCIHFGRNSANNVIRVTTSTNEKANQSLEFYLDWQGMAIGQELVAAHRISWGNNTFSIVFRQGQVPYIDKWGKSTTGVSGAASGKWFAWAPLAGAAVTDFNDTTPLRVRVGRMAGRMFITMPDLPNAAWSIADASYQVLPGQTQDQGTWQLKEMSWPSGAVIIQSFGVNFVQGMSRITYRVPAAAGDEGTFVDGGITYRPTYGTFGRTVTHAFALPEGGFLDWRTSAGGWQPAADSIVFDTPTLGGLTGNYAQNVSYCVVMKATVDGIDTPFCSGVIIGCVPQWPTPDIEPNDVSGAYLDGEEDTDEPDTTGGANWSLNFSPVLLDLIFGEDTQASPTWSAFMMRRNPISFSIRWLMSDFSYTPWVERLNGYITHVDTTGEPGNKWTLSVGAGTEIGRLQKPAAVIQQNYYPIDQVLFENSGEPVWGAQAIYEILLAARGPNEANRMNGNTTGTKPTLSVLMQYFNMAGHYPLISASTDNGGYLPLVWNTSGSGTPSSSEPTFPPPWGQDALTWMSYFAQMDFATFYYGFPTTLGDDGAFGLVGTSMCPIYGHYYTLMKSRPTWRIPDAIYVDGDLNQFFTSASYGDMPEWQYNEILIWNLMGVANNLPFPAIIQGGAELDPSDPESSQNSWRRSLVIQDPRIIFPLAAEGLAKTLMTLFAGQWIRRIRLTFVGEERMGWGDKLVPEAVNDSGVTYGNVGDYSAQFQKLSGTVVRVVRVNNKYKTVGAGIDLFRTTASCAPYKSAMESSF